MIYISGKEKDYEKAEMWLKLKNEIPINPSNVIRSLPNPTEEMAMKVRFALIEMCDSVLMIEGWKGSKTAKTELIYAKSIGKKINYQKYYKEFRKKGETDND